MPAEKHPHIENPCKEQLAALHEDTDPMLRQLYLGVHALVLAVIPDVSSAVDCTDGQIGYGAHQYGYNGWGMLALAAHRNWVTLIFMRGVDLQDESSVLEGTGKTMRHIKLRSLDEFERQHSALVKWIGAAKHLNERSGAEN